MHLATFYLEYRKISESELKAYLLQHPNQRDLNPAIFKWNTGPEDGMFTHCELQDNGILKVGSSHGRLHFDHSFGFWVRKDYLCYSAANELKKRHEAKENNN
jgi:hypothetical protein